MFALNLGTLWINIAGNTKGLDSAIKHVQNVVSAGVSKARDQAEEVAKYGGKMTAVGIAGVAPLVAAMKAFGDYGEQMDILHQQTGISQRALAALRVVAESSGTSIQTLTGGIRRMQFAITAGTAESNKGFASLGLSVTALKGLAPEEQFAQIAEKIAEIKNPAERAAAMMRIFGRGASSLVPILSAGRKGIEDAMAAAVKYGYVLSEEGTKKALEVDNAFDNLALSIKGFMLRMGEAAFGLVPFIQQITELIARVGLLIQQNPKLVQQYAQIMMGIIGVGAAITALGIAVMAALSPAMLLTGVLFLIATSVLAVLDTLGVTETGFADLFNSIQINGLGLADWFTWFWEHIRAGWGLMISWMTQMWAEGWNVITSIGHTVFQVLLETMELMAFAIDGIVQNIIASINLVLKAYNKAAGLVSGKIQVGLIEGTPITKDLLDSVRKANDNHMASWVQSQKDHDTNMANLDQEQQSLLTTFGSNVVDIEKRGTGREGIEFDKTKFMAGLEKIGGGIGEMMRGMFKDLLSSLPELPTPVAGEGGEGEGGSATGTDYAKNQFKQVSLRNFSIEGQAMSPGKQVQKVQDTEVTKRLDKLIDLQKDSDDGMVLE